MDEPYAICFYERNGKFCSAFITNNTEEAYRVVCLRQKDIQCMMLCGLVWNNGEGMTNFRSYAHYQEVRNSYSNKLDRAMFSRVVGPYQPNPKLWPEVN